MLQPRSKKFEILPFFRHAQRNPFTACSLLESAVWESLRRGRQGKLTERPYYFIPVDFFWVKCVRFLSCHDWEFWNSKRPGDFEDFLTIFWRVLNIAKNVWRCSGELSELPKLFKSDNFSLFWSRHGTKSLFSAFIHCRYSIFSGVVDNNSVHTQNYRSMQLLIVTE